MEMGKNRTLHFHIYLDIHTYYYYYLWSLSGHSLFPFQWFILTEDRQPTSISISGPWTGNRSMLYQNQYLLISISLYYLFLCLCLYGLFYFVLQILLLLLSIHLLRITTTTTTIITAIISPSSILRMKTFALAYMKLLMTETRSTSLSINRVLERDQPPLIPVWLSLETSPIVYQQQSKGSLS